MCGRMTLTSDNRVTVAQELRATGSPETMASLRPRFNVAPTQSHPVVMLGQERNVLGLAQWGFPGNQQTPLVINARAETIASRPMFKSAAQNGALGWASPVRKNHARTHVFAGNQGCLLQLGR